MAFAQLIAIVQTITAQVKVDPATIAHQSRTARLCVAIAKELKLKKAQIQNIYLGALIHDIGKAFWSKKLLNEAIPLSKSEMTIVKQHSQVGYDIIKNLKLPRYVKEMVLTHHERLDGSGYPKGLQGRQIKIGARILAVADSVDAMYCTRVYKQKQNIQYILAELKKYSGTWYDSKVAAACINIINNKSFNLEQEDN